jgi:sugar diacid utilization regulator
VSGSDPPVEDIAVRHQLSSLRSLLVLSELLTTIQDEGQILHIVASAVSSLGPCKTEAIFLNGVDLDATRSADDWPPALVGELSAIEASVGGRVSLASRPWAWAYPFTNRGGPIGHLIVVAESQPGAHETLLLEVLAQQAGAALANARLHARQRAQAKELRTVVSALERSTMIHQRLTQVAVAGEGQEGIARAVHELTGFPTAIEDRHGNLLAWAGPSRPAASRKDSPTQRARLLELALASIGPFRYDGRLVSVARPASNLVGLVALVDPEEQAGESDRVALEHATTVLALELTRLQNLTQSVTRLRAELVIELVAGSKGPAALNRAQALDYDLGRPHRVVMIEGSHATEDAEGLAEAVRRAARDNGVGTLVASRPNGVVLLADRDGQWEQLRSAILHELHGGRCRLGVGNLCNSLDDFPRSYESAQRALKLQEAAGGRDRVTIFEELGIYQILSDVADFERIEDLVRRWLGSLLDYDAQNGTQLVATIAAYLECGGNYSQTAATLFVHRNTLKYRLRRIREVSGLDLGSPDARFNLQLATRAWRTLAVLRAP